MISVRLLLTWGPCHLHQTQSFAKVVSGESTEMSLKDAAVETARNIVKHPTDPHWHVARAVYRALECAALPNDFSCLAVLQEVS